MKGIYHHPKIHAAQSFPIVEAYITQKSKKGWECSSKDKNVQTLFKKRLWLSAYLEIVSEHHPSVSFCLSHKGKPAGGYHLSAATVKYDKTNHNIKTISFAVTKPKTSVHQNHMVIQTSNKKSTEFISGYFHFRRPS
jgi:hypothetical protein